MSSPRGWRSWLMLGVFVLAAQGAGALGALTTDAAFYRALVRPAWSPPGWLFGPVWLTLYTMIGTAIWLVWRRPPSPTRTVALRWHVVQLVLNAAWTPIFFGLHALGVALIEIVALLVAIVLAIRATDRVSRPAAWLLWPYAAWVAFASVLTATLWSLNR